MGTESDTGRTRAEEPDTSDDAVREATGRDWEEWCDLLDGRPADVVGHKAIAAYLQEAHGVDGWWAQNVTVGYERITGLRLPHQRADGTFNANRTRTVYLDAARLRGRLLDDDDRARLFPGHGTELRSRPTSKVVRIAIGPGTAQIAIDPRPDGRVKVSVAHERLRSPAEVEQWKAYWGEWLAAIDEGA